VTAVLMARSSSWRLVFNWIFPSSVDKRPCQAMNTPHAIALSSDNTPMVAAAFTIVNGAMNWQRSPASAAESHMAAAISAA
jgi:hypothetical protein